MTDAFIALAKLLPSLIDLAKKLPGEHEAAKNNAQLIEFQNAIIQLQSLIASVQADNASLNRQKTDLEQELERLRSKAIEIQRYALVSPFAGATVYALKKEMSNGEAAHYLCPNCFKAGKTSILQLKQDKDQWSSFACSACPMAARTGYRGKCATKYAEEINGPE